MAPWLLAAAYEACERWQHIWADMAYRGQRLRNWVEQECGWTLEIVQRPPALGLVSRGCRAPTDAGLYRVAAAVGGGGWSPIIPLSRPIPPVRCLA
jgi:transposase